MNKFYVLIGLLILAFSCTNRGLVKKELQDDQLNTLVNLMSGDFSSREQAENDTLFYDINLVMYPIWKNDPKSKWLYVEQAVTKYIKKPYRQRVYKISNLGNGLFESEIYKLANPDNFIHGWEQPDVFNQINSDSLIIREGCAVFLRKNKDNCYTGSTKDKACKSTLRGAAYATSEVTICSGQVISWDQGWDTNDEQVWGAETEGYIFKKK